MKKVFTLKSLFVALGIMSAGLASAQIHPLAFGPFPYGTGSSDPNFYKDYVGLRFLVNSPAAVAGPKIYTYPGTGSTPWSAAVTSPINDVEIVMPALGGDTLAASAMPSGSMAGKIGYVYRGGGIEFVCKALNVQNGGAVACVIVNNQNGGPIGMGAGSICSSGGVTIPVFMISKEDGDLITAQYRAGNIPHFTITPWGLGAANDLGFVPGGEANWHSYAIPSNQLTATGNPTEYNMVNGAFIANYGTADATGVMVEAVTSFTPSEASTGTVQHKDTVSLASFPALDSIYAMFQTNEYSLATSGSGKGRFDVTYNIMSDVTDDAPADNSVTSSFYTTDSLYSKGRYDFTKNEPTRTIGYSFNSTGSFVWGPMYYVRNGGTAISRVQYSLSTNAGGALVGPVNIYLFKWTDGDNSEPQDSIVQNGELSLVSLGVHNYDGVNDTSGATLNFNQMGDPTTGNPTTIMLDANSWYYLAVEVPASHFLGADGIMHPLPRIYGRFQINPRMLDYNSLVMGSIDDITTTPDGNYAPVPGTFSSFVNVVDSFNYSNTKGLIPAVAMIVNNNPTIAVPNVPAAANFKINLYPNPTKGNMQVSLSLQEPSKKVSYTIIDGLGRFVSKEVHNNVTEDNFSLNTSGLAAGNYFLVVNTDSKVFSRTFTVAK